MAAKKDKNQTPGTKTEGQIMKLELNAESSRYGKKDYARMSDGMVP